MGVNNMTDSIAMNVTNSMAGLSVTSSWFGLMIIVGVIAVILSVFVMALSGLEGYVRARRWLYWCFKTTRYFFSGLVTLLVLAVPIGIFYYFISQASKGNIAPAKWTGGIIIGYVVIALIGYFGEKIYGRFKRFEKVRSKGK
jgi:hypothetical protein